jgi:hypothetical protein
VDERVAFPALHEPGAREAKADVEPGLRAIATRGVDFEAAQESRRMKATVHF